MKDREVNVSRLCQAMQRARLVLKRPREERTSMVRQYLGNHWSEEGSDKPIPVNLIALYVSVVGRNLIAKNPRVMLSTFDRQMKPAVAAMQDWANKEIERMRLEKTLQRIVLDALFSIGICKVAIATPAEAAHYSWNLRAGQPFAERVDLDDFVFDIHARDFNEVSFIGHRYRVPLEVVRDSKLYSKARKDLTASTDPLYNLEGDERISVLGRTSIGGDSEEFEDFVDLWEVYLPRHRQVLTLADDQLSGASGGGPGGNGEPLRTQAWLGSDQGPYHMLSLGTVPGNAMPKGPIQDLIDMHESVNRLYRKLMRQADRQKQNTFVQGGAMEDGSRVMSSNDGDILRVDNPDKFRQVEMGGPAANNFQLATHLKDVFERMAGNLALLGGLEPQSKTATQDKMLEQNASGQIAGMQQDSINFAASVLKSLAWYWWHDPVHTMVSKHSLPGLPEMQIKRQVRPDQRARGRFEDLQIEVDPYSMQHQSPQTRMAALDATVQALLPLMQLLQQQGVAFDIHAYLQKAAEYRDMPDLAEIFTIREPPQQAGPSNAGTGATMPQQTSREYVRRSIGQDTPVNRDAQLMNSLAASSNGKNGQMGRGM